MEEQVVAQPIKTAVWKWILGIILAVGLVAVGGWLLIFQVNQFSFVLEMAGEEKLFLEYGEAYEEPGVKPVLYGTLFFKEGITPKDVNLQVQSDLQEDALGKYTITYTADYQWWTASCQRTVRVMDTQCPVITLVEESEETILPGTAYKEEGFTAKDNYDGDITHKVIRTEELGKVTYAVLDSSGNPAYAEREIPYFDPLPPDIQLEGGEHITVPAGTFFEDPGFTAIDNADGDVTELVEVEGEVVWYQPGTYELTYTVSDAYENVETIVRTVEVVAQPRPEVVRPNGKVIYLTFDDGPGPYTDELLYLLDYYDVKATFFVVNSGYDSMMRQIVERGHSIGIHSMTHDYDEIYSSPEAFFADLYGMQEIIYNNTGVKTTLMRFPGGGSNMVSRFNRGIMSTLTEAVQDAGFQYFDWNVDSNDAGGATKRKKVAENVIEGVQKHRISVVLQHDIHGYSVNAVEDIILWGLDNGYQFLPLEMNSLTAHHTVVN